MTDISKHTPGPWYAGGSNYVFAANGMCVAICGTDNFSREVERANARLMAAAPDLLAALKAIIEDTHPDVRLRPDHIFDGRVAVAKAINDAAESLSSP